MGRSPPVVHLLLQHRYLRQHCSGFVVVAAAQALVVVVEYRPTPAAIILRLPPFCLISLHLEHSRAVGSAP